MKDHLRTYAQRLLHAFAEAGSLPAQELQPLIGPNGAVMWAEVAPASRPQLHSEDGLPMGIAWRYRRWTTRGWISAGLSRWITPSRHRRFDVSPGLRSYERRLQRTVPIVPM
jgi:hypothetical protein